MAEVYNGANDFVLFPRDRAFLDTLEANFDDQFNSLPYSPSTTMQRPRGLADQDTTYETYPPVPADVSIPSTYYGRADFQHASHKATVEYAVQPHTSSGSPSPATSQTFDHPSSTLSSASGASAQSTASSADGSPYVNPTHILPYQEKWHEPLHGLGIAPEIINSEGFHHDPFPTSTFDSDLMLEGNKFANFVDPSLIQHFDTPISRGTTTEPYPGVIHAFHRLPSQPYQPPSPVPSEASSTDSHRPGSTKFRSGTTSPYLRTTSYQPYPQTLEARRFSIASSHSRNSLESPGSNSYGFDDDGKERTRCPHPDCGRPFKDLKAHMLTHQSERPEKCPITNCAYHHKGFARKYDKNRHTLTHYKGNMVCGFCPGSGSALEKSFNRADVFKRHLTSVHGVEQTPPNSRKKSPNSSSSKRASTQAVDATGKCSTCSTTFKNAQEFYEHLDDCVLRVVQQEEPSELINEQHLSAVANDESVHETLDRHSLHPEADLTQTTTAYDEDDDNEDDLRDEPGEDLQALSASASSRSGRGEIAGRRGSSC